MRPRLIVEALKVLLFQIRLSFKDDPLSTSPKWSWPEAFLQE